MRWIAKLAELPLPDVLGANPETKDFENYHNFDKEAE